MQTDHPVGQIVQALKKNSCFENTLLIVTSDNGPSPIVHKITPKYDHSPSGPLRGMKFDLWKGRHRVPFIASWPARGISKGKQIAESLLLTDLYATVAAMLDIPVPDPKKSLNVLKSLLGEGAVRTEFVCHTGRKLGLRQNEWILLRGGGGKKDPEWRRKRFSIQSEDAETPLFNLSNDLGQRIINHKKSPEIAQTLSARLKAIQQMEKGK